MTTLKFESIEGDDKRHDKTGTAGLGAPILDALASVITRRELEFQSAVPESIFDSLAVPRDFNDAHYRADTGRAIIRLTRAAASPCLLRHSPTRSP